MAGRHGVPPQERRSHSRAASGQRRRRVQQRDAAQPWRLWLAFRGVLALIVLAACGWSVLLLTRHQGGTWPVVAVAAGVLSLLMIGLDVRARRRQRAELRRRATGPRVVPMVARAEPPPVEPPTPQPPQPQTPPQTRQPAGPEPFVPEPPPRPGRHSHRA